MAEPILFYMDQHIPNSRANMSMVEHHSLGQRLVLLLRSSAVGIVATLADLTTLSLLIWVVGMSPEWANVPSLVPGLAIMFIGNKYFAFEDRSRQVVHQGARFLFVEAWALAINVMLFHLLVKELEVQPVLARLGCTNVVYLGFSFPFWTYIFRKTPLEG